MIYADDGEEACANAIRFNDIVVMPAGFPKTEAALDKAGYAIVEVGNLEAAKLDGGLSCQSLRFTLQGEVFPATATTNQVCLIT
jgi:dimethylargininase